MQLLCQILYILIVFCLPIGYLFFKLIGNTSLEDDLLNQAKNIIDKKNCLNKKLVVLTSFIFNYSAINAFNN